MNNNEIKIAIEQAEKLRTQGNLIETYKSYCDILAQRLYFFSRNNHLFSDNCLAEDLIVMQSLADLATLFGDIQAADKLLNATSTIYQQYGNFTMSNFMLLHRIHLFLDRGLLKEGKDLLSHLNSPINNIDNIPFFQANLLEKWETNHLWLTADPEDSNILFSELYLFIGRLLCAEGKYEKSLISLNRGLFHLQKRQNNLDNLDNLDKHRYLHLKFMMATAYLEKGELDQARNYLNLLKNDFDETTQPEVLIRWLELVAKINLLCGNLGEAFEQLQKVLEICSNWGFQKAVLIATFNLVYVLIFLNQISVAKGYLMMIKSSLNTLKNEDNQNSVLIKQVEFMMNLADARGQSLVIGDTVARTVGQMRRGLPNNYINDHGNYENIEIFSFSRSANYLAFFEYKILAFHWYLSYFDLAKAHQVLSEIKEEFYHSDSQIIQYKIKITEGILDYYYGMEEPEKYPNKINLARSTFRDIIPYLKKLDLKPELYQVQRFYAFCLSRLKSPDDEILSNLTQETNNLLSAMSQSLSPKDQAIYLLNKWTEDEKYLAEIISKIQRLKTKINRKNILIRPWQYWLLWQKLYNLLKKIDRYKDVLAKRQLKNKEILLAETTPNFSLIKRLFTHPRDRITLSFLVLPDQIMIIQMGWLFLDFQWLPITRVKIRELVHNWHQNIETINSNVGGLGGFGDDEDDQDEIENDNEQIAQELFELLQLKSVLKNLPARIKKITIIPDDILHGFPFAVFKYEGKYLIEKYAISINYESTYKSPTSQSSIIKKTALLVGVSEGLGKFQSLGNVKPEIEKVRNWRAKHHIIAQIQELMNNHADKETIKQHLINSCFFHIASHGTFEYNQPDQSGFVLIVNSEKQILSLREISELDLTGLRHATLSSCWGADHFILPGRWIISLPETFWRSGTESILGCLWQVKDDVAPAFMERFYYYLDRYPRDESLQKTQLDCLNNQLYNCGNLDIKKPIYWSGFNLYGNYNKLKL